MDIRKIVVQRETLLAEAGTQAASPVTRVIAAAVFANPFAGRIAQDLSALFDLGAEIGARLVPQALAALAAPAVSYGKAALVGVNGDMEHGHALLHPKLGAPMRAAIGGGAALIPATVKLSSAGASLEVPLGHKDDLWSFDHIDTMTLSIADAPRPDEIVMAVAFADGARINARVPRF